MGAEFFVIWGDPTKPGAEIDPMSFVSRKSADAYVHETQKLDRRCASILELVEYFSGKPR